MRLAIPRRGILWSLLIGVTTFGFANRSDAVDLNAKEIRGKSRTNPVSVLQNRYFVKSMRPEVGVAAGTMLNEAYTDTSLQGYRFSLFLSEWLGIEFQHFTASVTDSDDRKALNELEYNPVGEDRIVSPDPEVNPISEMSDYNVVLAPFYGKLNLMDQMIVYSDLYFTAGFARVNTSQGELSAMSLGAGQRFYFFKSLSARLDFRDRIYTETRSGKKTTKHSYSVDLGMSYFFL